MKKSKNSGKFLAIYRVIIKSIVKPIIKIEIK